MACRLRLLLLLSIMLYETVAMTPDEGCELCQRVLHYAFTFYSTNQTTRRALRHKLKHLCRRYPKYTMHCLTILRQTERIREDMENGVQAGYYKSLKTCTWLKECDKGQSPLDFTAVDNVDAQVNSTAAIEIV